MKNYPGISEFRRGMEFNIGGLTARVEWVGPDGTAYCSYDGRMMAICLCEIPNLTLLPNSMWEGREYEHRRCSGFRASVLSVADAYVGYKEPAGTQVRPRAEFLAQYRPLLPLDPPAEEKPAEPWKPGRDKDAMYRSNRVFVRDVYRKFAWVVPPDQPEYPGDIIFAASLRPLPPESPAPPVQVGDVVRVQEKYDPGVKLYGEVFSAGPTEFTFGGTCTLYRRDYGEVTITHLVERKP